MVYLPKYTKNIYLRAQGAEPAPPLGTILGNLGVNTTTFCTNFNLFTKNIPIYFLLKVKIAIYENRSTSFSIDLPSTCYFLNLLKFEKTIKIWVFDRFHDKVISCVKLYEILKLTKLKFPELPLTQSFFIILGSVKSMNLFISKSNYGNK